MRTAEADRLSADLGGDTDGIASYRGSILRYVDCHGREPGRDARRCRNRVFCSVCAAKDGYAVRDRVAYARESVLVARPGYTWQLGTITVQADDPCAIAVDDIRARIESLLLMFRDVAWKTALGPHEDAGLVYRVEPGLAGHIHLHFIYWGPRTTRSELMRAVLGDERAKEWCGKIDVTPIDYDPDEPDAIEEDPRGSRAGLVRAARYIAKAAIGPKWSSLDEEDADAELHLLARFDLAWRRGLRAGQSGLVLGGTLGSLHGQRLGPVPVSREADEATVAEGEGAADVVRGAVVAWPEPEPGSEDEDVIPDALPPEPGFRAVELVGSRSAVIHAPPKGAPSSVEATQRATVRIALETIGDPSEIGTPAHLLREAVAWASADAAWFGIPRNHDRYRAWWGSGLELLALAADTVFKAGLTPELNLAELARLVGEATVTRIAVSVDGFCEAVVPRDQEMLERAVERAAAADAPPLLSAPDLTGAPRDLAVAVERETAAEYVMRVIEREVPERLGIWDRDRVLEAAAMVVVADRVCRDHRVSIAQARQMLLPALERVLRRPFVAVDAHDLQFVYVAGERETDEMRARRLAMSPLPRVQGPPAW